MTYEEEQAYRAFKPIDGDRVVIDLRLCDEFHGIHDILKEQLGLPEYYGRNWDALWDCLDGRFDGMEELTVEIHGYNALTEDEQKALKPMFEIFDGVHKDAAHVDFVVVS